MGKGRNKDLIQKRNESLLKRYYYWTEVQRLRFDDTLKILSEEEFFISEERILNIIRQARKRPEQKLTSTQKKYPRLTYRQLSLFKDDANFPIEQIRRDSRIGK